MTDEDPRLIAAAPDLLAALKELAILMASVNLIRGEQGMRPDYTEWLSFHDKMTTITRTAIAKARGA